MKRLLSLLLSLLLLFLSLTSCRAREPQSASFFLMDTVITVTLYTDAKKASPILAECRSILEELDLLWSRTRVESDVSRFNEGRVGDVAIDPRTAALLEIALNVAENTGGAFDVTVAPLIELWQACEKEGRVPTAEEVLVARAAIGADALSLNSGLLRKTDAAARIDLGGIGKGAAISKLVEYIASTEVEGALISFGSNVAAVGKKPSGTDFRIALRDPQSTDRYAGTLTLRDGEILSVSGDYERFYEINGERYHHILDPTTGFPSHSGLSSVAVICRDGALADALSTALLVMGEARARELYSSGIYRFEAVFITSDGVLSSTAGISVE